jgi:hypothetical protein
VYARVAGDMYPWIKSTTLAAPTESVMPTRCIETREGQCCDKEGWGDDQHRWGCNGFIGSSCTSDFYYRPMPAWVYYEYYSGYGIYYYYYHEDPPNNQNYYPNPNQYYRHDEARNVPYYCFIPAFPVERALARNCAATCHQCDYCDLTSVKRCCDTPGYTVQDGTECWEWREEFGAPPNACNEAFERASQYSYINKRGANMLIRHCKASCGLCPKTHNPTSTPTPEPTGAPTSAPTPAPANTTTEEDSGAPVESRLLLVGLFLALWG